MTTKVQLLKGSVVVCFLWHITCPNAEAPVESAPWTAVYSDEFREHYPTRGRRFDLKRYLLEAPVVVWDDNHEKKITVFLSVLLFRNITTTWITGKLVLIKLDIGHVAGVDAIYDAGKDKLVYCESVHYAVEIEPSGGADAGQPFRSIYITGSVVAGPYRSPPSLSRKHGYESCTDNRNTAGGRLRVFLLAAPLGRCEVGRLLRPDSGCDYCR